MMIRAANLLAETNRVGDLAGTATATPDWSLVADRIRDHATDNWDDTVAVDRFVNKGGIFVRGYATIVGRDQVEVAGALYRARTGIVIATGTRAAVPPIPGLAQTPYWTNHEIMEAKELPSSMIVLGGGAIGVEVSQVMARFGVKVTLVEGEDRLVPRNEPEAGAVLQEVFEAEGIEVHVGQFAASVEHQAEQFTVTLADGTELTGERLLVATGRQTFLRELGVEALGIDPDARFLQTMDNQRVQPGVWAVGDIAGDGLFTHLGTRQADVAAADILGTEAAPLNLDALSAVTFSDPEVGAVGLTEAEARDAGVNVAIGFKARGPHCPRLVALHWQRRLHQAGRRHGPQRFGWCNVGRPCRWRSTRITRVGRARRDPREHSALDDLRLSDLPQGHRGCAEGSLLAALPHRRRWGYGLGRSAVSAQTAGRPCGAVFALGRLLGWRRGPAAASADRYRRRSRVVAGHSQPPLVRLPIVWPGRDR